MGFLKFLKKPKKGAEGEEDLGLPPAPGDFSFDKLPGEAPSMPENQVQSPLTAESPATPSASTSAAPSAAPSIPSAPSGLDDISKGLPPFPGEGPEPEVPLPPITAEPEQKEEPKQEAAELPPFPEPAQKLEAEIPPPPSAHEEKPEEKQKEEEPQTMTVSKPKEPSMPLPPTDKSRVDASLGAPAPSAPVQPSVSAPEMPSVKPFEPEHPHYVPGKKEVEESKKESEKGVEGEVEELPEFEERTIDFSKPLFVRVNDYLRIIGVVDEVKVGLKEVEDTLSAIRSLNTEADISYENWRKTLDYLQKKCMVVDRILFGK